MSILKMSDIPFADNLSTGTNIIKDTIINCYISVSIKECEDEVNDDTNDKIELKQIDDKNINYR